MLVRKDVALWDSGASLTAAVFWGEHYEGETLSEGDAHGGHGASLRDYLRVVRRRKWIILLAVLLVPAVAVGLSLRQEKVYKATSQVLLVQQNPADQFNGIKDRKSTRLNSSHLPTSRMPSSA